MRRERQSPRKGSSGHVEQEAVVAQRSARSCPSPDRSCPSSRCWDFPSGCRSLATLARPPSRLSFGESHIAPPESSPSNHSCKSPLNTARCEATSLGPSGWRPRFASGSRMPRSTSCRRAADGSRSSSTELPYSRNRRPDDTPHRARSLGCSSSGGTTGDRRLSAMRNDHSARA